MAQRRARIALAPWRDRHAAAFERVAGDVRRRPRRRRWRRKARWCGKRGCAFVGGCGEVGISGRAGEGGEEVICEFVASLLRATSNRWFGVEGRGWRRGMAAIQGAPSPRLAWGLWLRRFGDGIAAGDRLDGGVVGDGVAGRDGRAVDYLGLAGLGDLLAVATLGLGLAHGAGSDRDELVAAISREGLGLAFHPLGRCRAANSRRLWFHPCGGEAVCARPPGQRGSLRGLKPGVLPGALQAQGGGEGLGSSAGVTVAAGLLGTLLVGTVGVRRALGAARSWRPSSREGLRYAAPARPVPRAQPLAVILPYVPCTDDVVTEIPSGRSALPEFIQAFGRG